MLFYWLFFSRAFTIEQIAIQGNFYLPQDQVNEIARRQMSALRWGFISERNVFAFDTEQFSRDISDKFALGKIYVKKDRPHKIILIIDEKPREAIWSTRGAYFALDSQGKILGQVAGPDNKNGLIIYDQSGSEANIGDFALSNSALAFLSRITQSNIIKPLKPRFFITAQPNSSDFLLKAGDSGWKIHFDASADAQSQINNLDLALRNSVPPDKRNNLEYIDLRFGEKVYVKYK